MGLKPETKEIHSTMVYPLHYRGTHHHFITSHRANINRSLKVSVSEKYLYNITLFIGLYRIFYSYSIRAE